ncbi:MAG: SDR family oxidoreductase [Burkholderiaceae bacterium]
MDLKLAGKCVWVVGATGTIGSGVASTLAQMGMHVWLSGRDRTRLDKLGRSISQKGYTCSIAPLVGPTDYEAIVEAIRKSRGRLDVLVNTTASPHFDTFENLTDQQWQDVFESKLLVYVRSMRAAIPLMRDSRGGVIINISGRGGRKPSDFHLAGGSMNAAINLLTKGIANAYQCDGIRANVIAPGSIRSARHAQLESKAGDSSVNSTAVPPGEVLDVVNAVIFLASHLSNNINGINLAVDGGTIESI